MASCAEQLFIIAKVGHILGFQAFCEKQQHKNHASGKPEHKITVVKAEAKSSCFDTTETICRSPVEQEKMGPLFPTTCRH